MIRVQSRSSVFVAVVLAVAAAACDPSSPRGEGSAIGVAQAQPANEGQAEPNAALQCYRQSRNELQLANRTAFLLCNGAASRAPVQCFAAARSRTRLLDPQIVKLCRCTSSLAPVTCFENGQRDTALIDDDLVQMCSATATQQLRGNCAPFVRNAQ